MKQSEEKNLPHPWTAANAFIDKRERSQVWSKDTETLAAADEPVRDRVIHETNELCGAQLARLAKSVTSGDRKMSLLQVDFCLCKALQQSELKLGACAKLKRKWFSSEYSLHDGDVKAAAAMLSRCTETVLGPDNKQILIAKHL